MKILHILRVILVAMLAVVLAGVPATAAGRRSKREQRREQSLVAELEKKGYLIPARLVKTPFDAQFNQLVLDVPEWGIPYLPGGPFREQETRGIPGKEMLPFSE